MRNWIFVICIALFCSLLLISCEKNSQPGQEEIIPNIIFDTDLGNSTDDVLAMHAMFSAREEGLCNVVGVMGDRQFGKAKDLLDRFLHYYNADDVPLGFVDGENQYFELIPYYQLIDSLKSDGTPLFEPSGIPLSERLPAWKLYRKLLSEAADNSITIVCVGMLTNLGLLLDSPADEFSPLTGSELVEKKVKVLELMAGCFTSVPLRYTKSGTVCKFIEVEYNIGGDIPLAQKVIHGWPGKINVFPLEEGLHFPSNHDAILEQYKWQPDSPIYQIYSRYDEWEKGDVGQYLWDLITMLHAIFPQNVFMDSTPGYIYVEDSGRTIFLTDPLGILPDPIGDHRIISMNFTSETKIQMYLEYITGFSPKDRRMTVR